MPCATEERPRSSPIHYKWQRLQTGHVRKITIALVTECETSTSGNNHILTIIDYLTGWLEAFSIPDKSADTIISTFINQYLPVHMCPWYILLDNSMEFKNTLMDQVLKQFGHWKNILSTLPPTKQWQIRGISKILETYFEEALWERPIQLE